MQDAAARDKAGLLSVLTLNAWGLLFVSKKRQDRMLEIGAYIKKFCQRYDCLCFQEVSLAFQELFVQAIGFA
eukprot:1152764-Pelagomonas_calceolata.AAC.1